MKMTRARWLLAAGACLVLGGAASMAATRYVGLTGVDSPGCGATAASPCRSIQFAISEAGTGDTVRVLPGTYQECVDTRGVRATILADAFAASGNRAVTVIDGTGICDGSSGVSAPAVQLGDGSALTGFTVRGGGFGGVAGFGSVAITQNVVTGNSGFTLGGGIVAFSSTFYSSTDPLRVEYNDVVGNTSANGGSGIFAEAQGDPGRGVREVRVRGNSVRNNTASAIGGPAFGAGMFIRTNSLAGGQTRIIVTQNQIEGNSIASSINPGRGGGIWAVSYAYGTDYIKIEGNTIRQNQSRGLAGGMGIFTYTNGPGAASVLVNANIVEANTAVDPSGASGYGGGIWASTFGYGSETITLSSNTVRNNQAGRDGGGISAWVQTATTGTQSVSVGGNTISSNTADRGAGLDLFLFASDLPSDSVASLSANDNALTGNAAGGPNGWAGGVFATLQAGRTNAPGVTFGVENNTITGNTAEFIGGGAMLFLTADADPQLDGNTARSTASIAFRRNLVAQNQATDTAPTTASAGGVLAYLESFGDAQATVDFDFNTVLANTAATGSGGLEIESQTDFDSLGASEGVAVVNVTNSIISGNTGFGVGGPIPGQTGGPVTPAPGTGELTVAFRSNDVFGNTGGNYRSWIPNPTGQNGNISADPLLDTNGVPGICSPTLDAADVAADFSLEPEPNGGRANMGHLGGTANAPQSLPDINGDRIVDGIDILRIASSFDATSPAPRYYAPADLNFDFTIDGDDLAFVASRFGTVCP